MKYCIRGAANIWGGHQVDLLMEMVEWLKGRGATAYSVVKFDEAKFADRAEAERFARKWFEPGRWRLHEMDRHCGKACTLEMKRRCAPPHPLPPTYHRGRAGLFQSR